MAEKTLDEQPLRPPVELRGMIASATAAALAFAAPSIFLTTPEVAQGVGGVFSLMALSRARQVVRLVRYQRNLQLLPMWTISSKDIPVSRERLFLGLGFEWGAEHTQRHYDINKKAKNRQFRKAPASYYPLVKPLVSTLLYFQLKAAAAGIQRQAWYNPFYKPTPVEGDPTLHSVGLWENENYRYQQQSERVAHTFVVGTTRVGKTRLAEVLIKQDIHNGDVVIVFDPKGDGDLLARMYVEAREAGRLDEFHIFHLGFPEHSCRYNPIGDFGRITEVAGRVASQLPSEGQSATFREFAWRYVNVIAKALSAIGEKINYEKLLQYGQQIDPLLTQYLAWHFENASVPEWKNKVDSIVNNEQLKMGREATGRDRRAWAHVQLYKSLGQDVSDSVASSLVKTFEYEKGFYDKLVASLFPLLEKLTSGPTAALLSPDYKDTSDTRPILDWMSVIRSGGIVYIGLDALSDADVAGAVGNSMFADLTSVAGRLYKHGSGLGLPDDVAAGPRRKICLHADEFNELVGKEFVPMANKAGGAGFQITAYTQTMSDIVVRFGDQAKAGQVIGNLGTVIMLRVKEQETAELLTNQLPDVEVYDMMLESGASQADPASGRHFNANNRMRLATKPVPLLHPGDLTRLPKGHCFALTGGRLQKLRLPMFKSDEDLPSDIGHMAGEMKKRYVTNTDWHNRTSIRFGD